MDIEDEPQSARAVAWAVHLSLLAVLWAAVISATPKHWYAFGGEAMHWLVALSIAQAIVGAVVASKQRASIRGPWLVGVGAAAVVVAVGLIAGGTTLQHDLALTAQMRPGIVPVVWAGVTDGADHPRQLALLIAGTGLLAAALLECRWFCMRRLRTSRVTTTVVVAAGIAAVAVGVAGVALVGWFATTARPVSYATLLVFAACSAVAVFAVAGALVAVPQHDDATSAAGRNIVGAATLATVAVAAIGLGMAAVAWSRAAGLSRVVAPRPDDLQRFAASVVAYRTAVRCVPIFSAAAALVGLAAVLRHRHDAGRWLRRGWGMLALTALLVAGAGVGQRQYIAERWRMTRGVGGQLARHTPVPLLPPRSSSDFSAPDGLAVVTLRNGRVWVGKDLLGNIDDRGVLARAGKQIAAYQQAAKARRPPSPFGKLWVPKPGMLSGHHSLGSFIVAADATTSLDTFARFLDGLQAQGATALELLVSTTRQLHVASARPAIASAGPTGIRFLEALAAITYDPWHTLWLQLADDPMPLAELDSHQLPGTKVFLPRLTLSGTEVVAGSWPPSAGHDKHLPNVTGQPNAVAITTTLRAAKRAAKDSSALAILHTHGGSLQDLVDVLDAARGPNSGQWLFSQPIWVTRSTGHRHH